MGFRQASDPAEDRGRRLRGALRAELERSVLQRQHGPEIEEIEVTDNALTLAAKVTAVATEDIARELRGDDQPTRPQLVQTA